MSSDLHTLSGAYALDAVEPDEAREFQRHMADCHACRDEVREFRAAAASMGASEALVPRADLKRRVLQAAERLPQAPPGAPTDLAAKRRRRLWLRVGTAAAGVALVAGAVVTQLSSGPSLSQPVSAVFSAADSHTAQIDTSNGGTIVVATSQRLGEMAVDTHGLPQLGRAQVYQLWEITGGHPQSAGLVKDPQAGRAMPMPPPTVQIAITIEPAGGSQQPTTTPIVVLRAGRV